MSSFFTDEGIEAHTNSQPAQGMDPKYEQQHSDS